ncbi:restriction endonuclease subunit S [Micromonospora sp. DT53]|uniref:restriction endonuclease subunit S n=1 Tax=Micromonospora sp. DT53 TaxID=3393444 RepID=UPI003CEE924E
MSDWREFRLEELASPQRNAMATGPFGSAISSRHFVASGVPVIRGSNLSLNVGTRLIDEDLAFLEEAKAAEFERSVAKLGDLIFTCWGTIGQLGLVDRNARYERYIVSNKQMKMTPDPSRVDPLFLYYSLCTPEAVARVRNSSIGSSVPGFNLTQLRAMTVKCPSLSEQLAIASILGALDDKIAVNDRIAGKMDDLSTALFEEATTNCSKASLASIATPVLGATPDRAIGHYWGGTVPWASAKDVAHSSFGVVATTEERITVAAAQKTRAKPVPPGSVVLTARGTVGAVARVIESSSFNQSCYAFIPGQIPPGVLFHMIRMASEHMLSIAHGTVFSTVNMKTFSHVVVPFLTDSQLPALEVKLTPLHRGIEQRLLESMALRRMRDTLLPELMSGRLRVREAEKVVEEAV